ncbi:GNAT family N-acetyltransferase [Synoicihabitans lomoniglobus]|uniref:GNAT family N-acetyltransferase n=1 Tax=Synoicihabitans lomoniglobus TaxID=2909285 RepID=A0AAE9ZUF6_9BACT|nr:GNAT family N-acetyltransferase [Opitutaceae bacterium LMO-M01]WED65370.1 GNAT family N-acetyltransferase [Opitutaceae bacterium LMO-M01]
MPSRIANLGYHTDCIFHQQDGMVEEREDHWVIRTPTNPTFWFGNLVLFKTAPLPGDFERWHQIHAAAFGQTLNHITLGWDEDAPGETDPFTAAGFEFNRDIVLAMSAYAGGVRIHPQLTIRPILNDADWLAVTALQVEVDRDDFSYRADNGEFRTNQAASYRKLTARGRGHYWGAFDGDTLVGSMGLYFDAAGSVGRFQYVTTRASHRRQRVCTTLLDHVIRHAFATVKPDLLVINTGAEDTNPAKTVYQSIGFQVAMHSYAVTRLL